MRTEALREFKAGIFQALAHPTRVAIAEILRDGECSVGSILERLTLEQANISQHLAVMRAKGVVTSRKEGNQVFYSLRHRMLVDVLDTMRLYFTKHLSEASEMLQAVVVEDNQLRKGETD
ncbi:MAG: winged helix-turn-helix transcriptional regulator [Candidatus Hydrogenedentes bacterium]|nr:winged helix-turn-helix transcriptional regulator [Candidatus Hydrogenedentota bacterium]